MVREVVDVLRVDVDFLLVDFLAVLDFARDAGFFADFFRAVDAFFVVFLRAVAPRFVVLRRARRFFGSSSFFRKLRSPGLVSMSRIKRNIAIKIMMFPDRFVYQVSL